MWKPWRNKTGLAKVAVILTTILSIATVSCGLNYALAMASMNSQWAIGIFIAAGWIELGAIVSSLVGLLVVLLIWVVSEVRNARGKDIDD